MQQPKFPKYGSEKLVLAEVMAARRVRTRRLQALVAGAGATLLALVATGCPEPADLENPGQYMAPASTGTAGTASTTGGSGSGADPCEVACVKTILSVSLAGCKICHQSGANGTLMSGQLDLVSPGVTARLKDVPAKHVEILPAPAAGDCPTGDKLIDTANPSSSWLLTKIKGMQKTCGTIMPTTALPAADMACMETYVSCVAGKAIGGGSGGSAAGGSAATGGGGGTGGT